MQKISKYPMAWPGLVLMGILMVFAMRVSTLHAQAPAHTDAQSSAARRPIRITMETLHRHGGVPPGWQFTVPEGDPVAGREVFVLVQCYTCHTIAGEHFPPVKPAERVPAPELTGVGLLHPAAYLAEAVLNPNAVVVEGPGYVDADGLSKMPHYTDILTVRQWLDLVAYLRSLREPGGHHATPGHQHTPSGEHSPQTHGQWSPGQEQVR